MGCGKSHWGAWAAARLGCPFLDLDEAIVQTEQKTIAAIFDDLGEAGFRAMERRHLHATGLLPPTIVATGGGAPCFFDNMDWMNAHGHTLFIDVPPAVLAKRLLPEQAKRPLIRGVAPDQLENFIAERLAVRLPFYEKAHTRLRYQEDPLEYERSVWQVFQDWATQAGG